MSAHRKYDHDAVLDMWARGLTGGQIALKVRGTINGIRSIIWDARLSGDPRATYHAPARKKS